MNAQHTPTPWTAQEMPHGCNDAIMSDDGEGTTICEFPYGLDANADFIVKAANAHDDLVAALNDIVVTAVDADLRATFHRAALELVVKKARAALTKAGAA